MPPYRIITFDGGGVRGSLMATLVRRLVENRELRLLEHSMLNLKPLNVRRDRHWTLDIGQSFSR